MKCIFLCLNLLVIFNKVLSNLFYKGKKYEKSNSKDIYTMYI